MRRISTCPVVLLMLLSPLFVAAQTFTLQESLRWDEAPTPLYGGEKPLEGWLFEGAAESELYPGIPFFFREFPVGQAGQLEVTLVEALFEDFERKAGPADEIIGETLRFSTRVERDRDRYFGTLSFVPLIRQGDRFRRLTRVELRITLRPASEGVARGPVFKETSALSGGNLFKIAVQANGVYRLNYDFLKKLGLDIDNIDPRTIKLLGNGGGILPSPVNGPRVDDLEENHILIVGEEDGKFNSGDYLLFYGQGADRWHFDPDTRRFDLEKNHYDTRNYYFIKVSPGNGLRMTSRNSLGQTAYTTASFDDYAHVEEDKVNLLFEWEVTRLGAGQRWFGDYFKVAREYTYNQMFRFPGRIASAPVRARARMALRASVDSRFLLEINGQTMSSNFADNVSIGTANDYIYNFANLASVDGQVSVQGDDFNVKVSYPNPGGNPNNEGWLDFVQVQVRRQLNLYGQQTAFRDLEAIDHPTAGYQVGGVNANTLIWDITDPLHPVRQQFNLSGSQASFGAPAGQLRQFVAFDGAAGLLQAEAIGRIDNQNLHAWGLNPVDMIILYHPDFETAARQLADHRRQFSGLEVVLAPVSQVFNEFSSGKLDPTAIRDLARMVYERNDRFRYLLLFGDGSFDARNIYGLGNNFIPTYQRESFSSIQAFPADDYFGILNNEGVTDPLSARLNLAIGRLPVKTAEEAQAVVAKIIHYDTAPQTMGDWRNRLVFVGDDEDGNRHTSDADDIADDVNKAFPDLNVEKLYLDAFPQVATTGGDFYPAVNDAITTALFKGVLAITYLGHGGPRGWAQERVLQIEDIRGWRNMDNLALFVTATCSFTGYDDPTFVSAGEETFLNPRGGAIALMTTTRAVYANANKSLTERALMNLLVRENQHPLTLGEAIQRAKNSGIGDAFFTINSRKFTLIGDPATRIPLPEYGVSTVRINGREVDPARPDTLRAFQKITVEGFVHTPDGQVAGQFNGLIYPTIFDKPLNLSTLGQDPGSPVKSFKLQKNVIFKGKASVSQGRFQFTFVVPKDINFAFGPGKISYYAADLGKKLDASGHYEGIVIGGTSADALTDKEGPEIQVFMNSDDFIFGGITDENPTLLVRLSDENGINVVGNSIGHDLEGVLNEDTQNSYLLNDFYEAETDDYTRGSVRYPLYSLPEGRHAIRVKAWDVANNASEGFTEFIVAPSATIALRHVLNYPNPFTDQTCFQFDHNMNNQEMDVLVQIYTIAGRLVKTIEQRLFSDGAIRLDDCISWDGRDDFGDPLARGVYLYKVKVRVAAGTATLSGESDFEKLVILK